ncbi:4Fe-4S binding protein [Neobacillus sp. SCS-31]|uniref:4Fe-4S binding protein n=1 Tax=Neobacillus oceani TaxID=3115292 RepID=UPI003905B932
MSLLTKWLESLSGEIELTPSCLRAVSPKSSCAKCISSCPEQAITISEAGATIDPALCTTCGACIPACPVQAIHGRSPERHVIENVLMLEEGPFPVAEELLYFYKKGANTLYFGMENPGYPDALQIADSLLAGMGLPSFTIVQSHPASLDIGKDVSRGTVSGRDVSKKVASRHNVEGREVSRRQFFHHALRESTKTAAKTLTPAKWRFNHSDFRMAGMFPGISLYDVELDQSSCTLCQACFKLCKQHVFTIKDDTLEIHHGNCNGCDLCTDVCGLGAVNIRLKAHQALQEELPLTQGVCGECGTAYQSWTHNKTVDSTCPACENRKTLGYLNPYCS